MESTLKTAGLDQAFVLMDQLFKTEPDFVTDCHGADDQRLWGGVLREY